MPIIFVAAFGDVPMSVRAMRAVAFEFLTKPFTADALLTAVKQALECSGIALKFQLEMSALKQQYASLSCREQQVMGLVISGMWNKQVGFELGISEITVKAHRGNVMRKMRANSFAALISMAAQLNLVKQWPCAQTGAKEPN
jgi:FixJ family two-component response regulator